MAVATGLHWDPGADLMLEILGHHGSRTSTTDAFLRRVSPRFSVYCVGAGNRFGFPNPDVLARTPGEHFSTADGAVIAESDSRLLRVRSFTGR